MRMRKNLAVRISGAILLCLLLLLPACASAIDPIDMEQKNTLTIECTVPEGDQAGAKLKTTFKLYRVADMVTPFAEFELAGDFKDYPVIINDLDSAGWKRAALSLATYAEADNIAPLQTYTVSNSDPEKVKPFVDLPAGLYLVTFDRVVLDKWIYTMAPILVSLPTRKDGSDDWIYDVPISASKWQAEERDMLDLTVLKVWDDAGWKDSRPKKITVELLKDGKSTNQKIDLPHNNKWSYTWKDLDPDHKWSVRENPVPEHYTVDIDQEDNGTYVITNTRPEKESTDKKLPQTGLDWWPVAVLAVAGMALFFLGWLRRRQEDDDDEEAEA